MYGKKTQTHIQEAVCSITGSGVFGFLKFESGVHRVQRVPDTESGGRVHTSTITCAVLPQPDEVNLNFHFCYTIRPL